MQQTRIDVVAETSPAYLPRPTVDGHMEMRTHQAHSPGLVEAQKWQQVGPKSKRPHTKVFERALGRVGRHCIRIPHRCCRREHPLHRLTWGWGSSARVCKPTGRAVEAAARCGKEPAGRARARARRRWGCTGSHVSVWTRSTLTTATRGTKEPTRLLGHRWQGRTEARQRVHLPLMSMISDPVHLSDKTCQLPAVHQHLPRLVSEAVTPTDVYRHWTCGTINPWLAVRTFWRCIAPRRNTCQAHTLDVCTPRAVGVWFARVYRLCTRSQSSSPQLPPPTPPAFASICVTV